MDATVRFQSVELLKGNCLERMKEIEPGSVDLVLADLPYGTTRNKWDSVIPLDQLWPLYWRVLKENGAVVLTATQPFSSLLVTSELKNFKYEWIWNKSRVTGVLNAKKQPLRNHEVVLVFYRKQPTYNPQGIEECIIESGTGISKKRGQSSENYGRVKQTPTGKYTQTTTGYPRSVLSIPSEGSTIHPTQKPVALMEYLINTYSNEGDLVLDNTMGSGTTGVACINTKRRFIGIEMGDEYFEMASERIKSMYN